MSDDRVASARPDQPWYLGDAGGRADVQAMTPDQPPPIPRRIVGFHQDDEGHWVAELECGHGQHVRHDPPWQLRPWVLTPQGRAKFIGVELLCKKCAAMI